MTRIYKGIEVNFLLREDALGRSLSDLFVDITGIKYKE